MLYRVCCLLLLCSSALAELRVEDAWARATAPGAQAAVVYGTFSNHGTKAIKLVTIRTEVARMPMLHETRMEGDMMRMRHLDAVVIEPNKSAEFVPGGLHIMLNGLERGLKEGETFDITVELEGGETLVVPVRVGAMGQVHAH